MEGLRESSPGKGNEETNRDWPLEASENKPLSLALYQSFRLELQDRDLLHSGTIGQRRHSGRGCHSSDGME